MVPWQLNDHKKEHCIPVCQDIIECLQIESDSFHSHHWGWDMVFWIQPGNQVPELSVEFSDITDIKVMLITFFVHSEFLLQNQTVNQQVYKDILQCMLLSVCKKREELWWDKLWLLHYNNTFVHNALSIWQFLYGNNSPFIWSCSLWLILFFKLKGIIKETHFEGVEAIKRANGHPRRLLPVVHRSMAEKDEKVH